MKIENSDKNVLGSPLKSCCGDPVTGFYRNGYCQTGPQDLGKHVVCASVTDDFLQYSKGRGNDLTRAMPEYGFAGLKQDDKWCLCAERWIEAHRAGVAPPIYIEATHERMLDFIDLAILKSYAVEVQ